MQENNWQMSNRPVYYDLLLLYWGENRPVYYKNDIMSSALDSGRSKNELLETVTCGKKVQAVVCLPGRDTHPVVS